MNERKRKRKGKWRANSTTIWLSMSSRCFWFGFDLKIYLWERCWLVVFLHFIECNMQIRPKPFKSRCITIIANCRQFKTIAYTFQIRTQFFVSLGVIAVQVHALIRTRKTNATGEKRNENCCFNWIHSEWFASFFYFCVPWIESAYKTLCKKMVTNIHFFFFSKWNQLATVTMATWLNRENASSSNDF